MGSGLGGGFGVGLGEGGDEAVGSGVGVDDEDFLHSVVFGSPGGVMCALSTWYHDWC